MRKFGLLISAYVSRSFSSFGSLCLQVQNMLLRWRELLKLREDSLRLVDTAGFITDKSKVAFHAYNKVTLRQAVNLKFMSKFITKHGKDLPINFNDLSVHELNL